MTLIGFIQDRYILNTGEHKIMTNDYFDNQNVEETLDRKRMCHSIRNVAESLGVSTGHVFNEIKRGKLRSIKSGRRVLIMDSDLWQYLVEQVVEIAK